MTFWIAGAGLAMGAVSMVSGGQTASAQAKGSIATTKGQLEVQKANQHIENAQSSFGNFMTAFNNNRQLKQFGKAKAASASNAANTKDSLVANKLEASLRDAEQRGALAANMGFSGSAGASFDALESSMRLKQARAAQNTKDTRNQLNYSMAQEQLGLIDNGLMGLDMTVHSGGVNVSRAAPEVTGGTNYIGAFASSNMLNQIAAIAKAWPSGSSTPPSSLTGGGLGLKTGNQVGLYTPSASTNFFNLGNFSSPSYSLIGG